MTPDLLNGENSGVQITFKPSDDYAGGESRVTYEARNPLGDWSKYRPTDEWQRRYLNGVLGYDTESCVTFSGIRIVCMQLEFMKENGLIPEAVLDEMKQLGYFDANGKFNFSEWFSANTNGTTEQAGNSLQNFWDGVHRDGLLPQSAGPSVNDFTKDTGGFLDASKITPAQRTLALKFRDLGFDAPYEWAVVGVENAQPTFAYHLKQAPLHVLVPTCSTWNDPKAQTCPLKSVNHAVSNLALVQGEAYVILDHYNPFLKKLDWGYYVPYAVKAVVTYTKPGQTPPPFTYTYTVNLKYGMVAGAQIHALQQGLQKLGYMPVGVFGAFGPQTRLALGKFQTAKGITDPDGQGTNFGPQTRAALTKDVNR